MRHKLLSYLSVKIRGINSEKLLALMFLGAVASSPENALHRAFELFRKLIPYKFKYGLESPEAVFEFLEKQASDGKKKAVEAEERLQGILANPEDVFYEVAQT